MSIEHLFGNPRRLVKFVSLTIGLLMIGAIVACMIYGQPWWLAVAAGVVGAWALLIFTEVLKDELREMIAPSPAEQDDNQAPHETRPLSRG